MRHITLCTTSHCIVLFCIIFGIARNMFKWLDIISIWIIYLNHREVTEECDKRPRADCLDLREYKEKRQKGD